MENLPPVTTSKMSYNIMKINHLHASEGGKHLGKLRFLRHYHTAILLFR